MRIHSADDFTPYFERIRSRTRRVVEFIPPDRLEWTHAPRRFTLGDLVRHLAAAERWMFAENVAGRPSRYPGHGPDLADGYEAVLAYLDRLHTEAAEIFGALTPSDLERKCPTPAPGVELATWKWLRAMVEHEIHHRGQIYLMLGILGIETPPLYGLTSEQVRENSLPL